MAIVVVDHQQVVVVVVVGGIGVDWRGGIGFPCVVVDGIIWDICQSDGANIRALVCAILRQRS